MCNIIFGGVIVVFANESITTLVSEFTTFTVYQNSTSQPSPANVATSIYRN